MANVQQILKLEEWWKTGALIILVPAEEGAEDICFDRKKFEKWVDANNKRECAGGPTWSEKHGDTHLMSWDEYYNHRDTEKDFWEYLNSHQPAKVYNSIEAIPCNF